VERVILLLKNLLDTLNGCLVNVTNFTLYKSNMCHIQASLNDGKNHVIYISQKSPSRMYLSLGEGQNECVVTQHLPENNTKFTRISLNCTRDWTGKKASKRTPPYNV
jgi:hypothetical protein